MITLQQHNLSASAFQQLDLPEPIRVIAQPIPPFQVFIHVEPTRVSEADINERQAGLFRETALALIENQKRISLNRLKGLDTGKPEHMPSGKGRYAMSVDGCVYGYQLDPHRCGVESLGSDWFQIVANLKRDLAQQKAEVRNV